MDVDEESTVGWDRRLTLTEVKAWSFGKLEGLTTPFFLGGLVKPSLSQLASWGPVEPHPAFDKFPFLRQVEVALLVQNRAIQGLDESVPEKNVSVGDLPLKAIDADETIFKNGLSLRRPAIRGLNVAKYYQPHDAPCRLDVVSLCGKDVKPVLTPQHLENVQRATLAQVVVASLTRSIRKALSPGDWVTSIDLKDAYFHVPVHPDFRKYLRVGVGGKVCLFRALPFGLSPALREFCQVTGVLGTLLHKLNIYLHLYFDDWLLRATSRAICLAHTKIALEKAQNLGFLLNWAKSELIPAQRFVFLREAYNLLAGLVRSSEEAVAKFLTLCRVLGFSTR